MKLKSKQTRGVIFALLAGICWGFSGTVGQYLFTRKGMNSTWLTVVRMLFAGILLLGMAWKKTPKSMKEILENKKDLLHEICFAICGLMAVQLTYMKTIFYSNSGTATAIQYLGIALVLAVNCIRKKRLPLKREIIGMILAMAGVFVLATHGSVTSLALSPLALTWGLASAVALAIYTMSPGALIRKYGSYTVVGYGMLMGGLVLGFLVRVWRIPVALDLPTIIGIVAIVVIGTAFAFAIYLQSTTDIGGVKAGMLACTELASAPIIAAIWLHTKFSSMDFLGFVLLFIMVIMISKKESE